MIETVDSFQGKQLDVVMLSCVRAAKNQGNLSSGEQAVFVYSGVSIQGYGPLPRKLYTYRNVQISNTLTGDLRCCPSESHTPIEMLAYRISLYRDSTVCSIKYAYASCHLGSDLNDHSLDTDTSRSANGFLESIPEYCS